MNIVRAFATVEPAPIYVFDKNLDQGKAYLIQAQAISQSLASSPSQNEDKRREVADILHNAVSSLMTFSSAFSALGWAEENSALSADIDAIRTLADNTRGFTKKPGDDVVRETKVDLSWADINTKILAAMAETNKCEIQFRERTDRESRTLVQNIQKLVEEFHPVAEYLTEVDWLKVESINTDAKLSIDKCRTFPLLQKEPWNAEREIGASLDSLEAKVATLTGSFANQAEALTRKLGLARQTGRKTAIWTEKNKWYIIGGLILLLAASTRPTKKGRN